jgi:ABC-type amino acid transport substrate-binding protein
MRISLPTLLITIAVTAIALFNQCAQADTATKKIPLITYYDYPPFTINENGDGLNRDLAQYLTKMSKGKYTFESMLLPKGRLDNYLKNDKKWFGVVAWANPLFVNDESKNKYVWSDPIYHEIDYVASLKKHPIEFQNEKSLYGHTLGTVLNQRYPDVEKALNSGKIKKRSVTTQHGVVLLLLKERVDVAFISHSTIKWFRKEFPDFDKQIHLAKKPRNEFNRYIFTTKNLDRDVEDFVIKNANNLTKDREWQNIEEKY